MNNTTDIPNIYYAGESDPNGRIIFWFAIVFAIVLVTIPLISCLLVWSDQRRQEAAALDKGDNNPSRTNEHHPQRADYTSLPSEATLVALHSLRHRKSLPELSVDADLDAGERRQRETSAQPSSAPTEPLCARPPLSIPHPQPATAAAAAAAAAGMEANPPPFGSGPRLQRRVEADVPTPGVMAIIVLSVLAFIFALSCGFARLRRDAVLFQRAAEDQRADRREQRERLRTARREERAASRRGQYAGASDPALAGPSSAAAGEGPSSDAGGWSSPIVVVAEPPPVHHRRRRQRGDSVDVDIEMQSQAGPSRGQSHPRSPRSRSHHGSSSLD
ncbi:hypothetical protein GGTG_04400 [Gaeumannomyces tritici R3-111a-1]|uniref:Uncharacterized protein n=1 Tax=Gaeumannomyces tritici (strain R3-111a-1) TaxID=644352 RepID=J3NT02_GAET3|nr:hypothetical protein GGTG_04400 [Gaeumannomyces tritici R3-111a-1]EJT79315.1 hypothetical protein GGTG_04400 [Gaeumannomyces tritici R3-111a-1]